MKIKYILAALGVFLSVTLQASACGFEKGRNISLKAIQKKYRKKIRKISSHGITKFAKGHPSPSWETRLGNLLLDNIGSTARKIVLSIPAQIHKGDWSPFGDGQRNAKMTLGSDWKQNDFPVVGVETTEDGKVTRQYHFHSSLNVQKYTEKILTDTWYEVTPEGWNSSYYFNFQTSALPISEFIKGIPPEFRTFPPGRVAPNVAQISKMDPIKQLSEKDLGPGFNSKNAWYSENVHGIFPGPTGLVMAVGGVLTWGVATEESQRPQSGSFKYLYTCFDPRNINAELTQGIPSGAGWHYVGDPAETVVNSLSDQAIPFAMARSHGKSSAYGLTESITAMWLQSDEVQVTRRGEFHWYLNPYEQNVCTEIWVHNCVPNLNNHWGFKNDCK